jgi:hypothetical protein
MRGRARHRCCCPPQQNAKRERGCCLPTEISLACPAITSGNGLPSGSHLMVDVLVSQFGFELLSDCSGMRAGGFEIVSINFYCFWLQSMRLTVDSRTDLVGR